MIQALLVREHLLEPLAADVALTVTVDRVADLHIVGRHTLRNRAGGAACLEKPATDFLPGANLGEGAVTAGVEIDLQGLLECGKLT